MIITNTFVFCQSIGMLPVTAALKIKPKTVSGSVKNLIQTDIHTARSVRGGTGMVQGFNGVAACVVGTDIYKGRPL